MKDVRDGMRTDVLVAPGKRQRRKRAGFRNSVLGEQGFIENGDDEGRPRARCAAHAKRRRLGVASRTVALRNVALFSVTIVVVRTAVPGRTIAQTARASRVAVAGPVEHVRQQRHERKLVHHQHEHHDDRHDGPAFSDGRAAGRQPRSGRWSGCRSLRSHQQRLRTGRYPTCFGVRRSARSAKRRMQSTNLLRLCGR